VDSDNNFTGGRLGREHLACVVTAASDFHPEVAQQRGTSFFRVVDEDVVVSWPLPSAST
jgi:hypothetical protein